MCRMERGGSLISDEATKLIADERAFLLCRAKYGIRRVSYKTLFRLP
jgi:hypothetical protein